MRPLRSIAATVLLPALLGWTVSGCRASVAESVHRAALAEQQREYEERLRRQARDFDRFEREQKTAVQDALREHDGMQRRLGVAERALADKQRLLEAATAPGADRSAPRLEGGALRTLLATLSPLSGLGAGRVADPVGVRYQVPADRVFERGAATLSAEGAKLAELLAGALTTVSTVRARLEIHGDDLRAGQPGRYRLAASQGDLLAEGMIAKGADPARLSIELFGPYRPARDNQTGAGRAQNRRVEIVFFAVARDPSYEPRGAP